MTLLPSLLQFDQFILSASSLAQWEQVSFLRQPLPTFFSPFAQFYFLQTVPLSG